MPEVTEIAKPEIAKPEFKSEKAFEYKGPKKTIDIVTAQVSRGSSVGTGYVRAKSEDIKFDDLSQLFDVEDIMEEIVRPALDALALKASKIATAEAITYQKNEDGSFALDENKNKIVEELDDDKFQKKFLELFGKLSIASESARALKQQHEALMEKWGKTDPKTNYDAWMNMAKELHVIQAKRDALSAQKAASAEAAEATETPVAQAA